MSRPQPAKPGATEATEPARTATSRSKTGTRPGVAAPTARRRAKRRQAVGMAIDQRLRRFDTALPGLRIEPMHGPALPMSTIGFTGFVWSKALSGLLLLGVLLTLIWINADERWYVYPEHVKISGARLVGAPLLSEATGVNGWNIFWLRQSEVRNRVLENPWIEGATVSLGLPAQVQVQVTEAPVVALWSTGEGDFWISPTGAALPVTEAAAPDMARLIDPQMAALRPGSAPGTAVDTNIVASALALMENVPGVTEVRYSPDVGLHFGLPGTTLYVHWGDGENMEKKLDMLNLGRQLAATGEMDGHVLDVRFPDVVTTR